MSVRQATIEVSKSDGVQRRTRCGIIGADARPNWQEQPTRETLTGMQWR